MPELQARPFRAEKLTNEVYGRPTDMPWALTIHEWDLDAGRAVIGPDGAPVVLGTFHPAFLYELLWTFAAAAVVIWADRRFRLGHGRAFGLYVVLYTLGRLWIEALRIDQANTILGLRLNIWTSLVLGLGAAALTLWSARRHPGREDLGSAPAPSRTSLPADAADSNP
ncbi:prolipoprotein diacylglyceryl transferase [Lentzea sp. BCCO 10_0798]|uniref:Prolipoprotein diacylglyceryl transferase n=1 Tax=Lentzea kristufekii TaxID=3095430 RepID=A0ABU4TNE0_9PSEU|nr:prolipoprotein diacylglyceryl transferase family protein [Lentzea sp. BCCO 10_0798]MDX8049810.1 prolipoprotein diacylglyceryl transferase [Lentzea sp. BCCO 10_0798]